MILQVFLFLITVIMALINLPFVLQDGGSIINLCALIYISACAAVQFVFIAKSN